MKLELGFIEIKDIQFSKESKLENGILFVNIEQPPKNDNQKTEVYHVVQ